MKILLIVFFLTMNYFCYSQQDSTLIRFQYLENEDLILINRLNNIQMIDLICSDTLLREKHFFLTINEYKSGELSNIDSLNLKCVDQEFSMITNEDTLLYMVNYCDYIKFDESEKEFKIKFAGKLQDDSLKLIIKYPYFGITRKLKGNEDYSLREITSSKEGKAKIKTNIKVPIMAYTSPFESGGGIDSYCLLDSESPKKWFEKYNIKHFYIFYLEIK